MKSAHALTSNIHRHLRIIVQNGWPASTKQNPKKKATSPRKKPCQVMAYNSKGRGLTSITSATKHAITTSSPAGLPSTFFIDRANRLASFLFR